MQYLLTKEELDNLVPQHRLYDEQKKVEMLVENFITTHGCDKIRGYCDHCPIASLNNKFNRQVCFNEKYSK